MHIHFRIPLLQIHKSQISITNSMITQITISSYSKYPNCHHPFFNPITQFLLTIVDIFPSTPAISFVYQCHLPTTVAIMSSSTSFAQQNSMVSSLQSVFYPIYNIDFKFPLNHHMHCPQFTSGWNELFCSSRT